MSSALQVIEQINEQLLCAICLERLSSPKLLQCMHTFCCQCLHRIVNNDPNQSLTCPTCREVTPLPENGIDSLASNFFVNQLLDLVQEKSDQLEKELRENRKCNFCAENEPADIASSRCVDCNKDLCTGCLAEHKRARATVDHRIFALADLMGEQDNGQELDKYNLSFCRFHTRNMIKYFCNTCEEAICRVCTILEHREHEYVYPKEALPAKQDAIADLLTRTKLYIPELKRTLKQVEEMSQRLNECRDSIAKEVNQNTQTRINALLQGEAELLRQLDQIHVSKQKVLSLQKDSIELEIGKLSGCCEFAENVLKFGGEVEVLNIKSRLESLNNLKVKFEPEEDDTIQYVCEPSSTTKVVDSLGVIHASSTFASISYASGDGVHTARVKIEARFNLVTKDRHGERCKGGDRVVVEITQPDGTKLPSRIDDEGNGKYAVYYTPEINGKHQVYVSIQDKPIKDSPFTVLVINRREYNEVGPSLMKFGQYGSKRREFKSPFGIAVDTEGHIYVADSYNHRIQIFGPKGEYVGQFGSHGDRKGEFNCPTDVIVDHNNRVIVCDNGNNRIQVFSRTGGFIGKFGREGTGNGYFKSPWGIAVSRKNDILVADMENNRVQIFSQEGKFTGKFGSIGERMGQFNSPCYILVNPEDDTIFVSDTKNHRIQVFDRHGKSVRQLGSQGGAEGQFTHPRGLALDIAGNVVVADMGNHRLQVLTAEGQFIKEIGTEGNGEGQLSFPESVAIMPNSGYIVVSDLSNNRIQVF